MFIFQVYLKCCGKMLICLFNESTGNPKGSYLALVVFHELCVDKCWKLMAMFHLLKIRTSIDIFKNEKGKVTFGLGYILKCLWAKLRFLCDIYMDTHFIHVTVKFR